MEKPAPELAETGQVTMLLGAWRRGDRGAEQQLIEVVYAQLHAIALRAMSRERPDHTLHPTELIHEAWLRLEGSQMGFEDRAHFLSLSAVVMRRILVDHARARSSQKRFGSRQRVSMEEAAMTLMLEKDTEPERLLDLDRALTKLAEQDPRKGRLMELVYFGGLAPEEAAVVLTLSVRTVQRDIQFSKVWLRTQMQSCR